MTVPDHTTIKTCTKCGETKPTTAFCKNARKPDGLHPACRDCQHAYYVANRETILEQQKTYYAAHRKEHAEWVRSYREINRETEAKRNQVYREANREARAEYNRAYYEANQDKSRAKTHRRRALERNNGGSFTSADIDTLKQTQTDKRGNLRCWYCGKAMTDYHVDHFIPLAKGGSSSVDNLRLACPTCNLSKSAKHPHQIGRLL
jgi:5-methylcytosine-specific restriction endonuclease McrA